MLLILAFVVLFVVIAAFGIGLVRPGYAFGAAMTMFPLEQFLQSQVPFFQSNPAFLNYAYAIALLVVFGFSPLMGGRPLVFNFTIAGIYFLVLFAIVSVAWSPFPEQSLNVVSYYIPRVLVATTLFPAIMSRSSDVRDAMDCVTLLGLPLTAALLVSPFLGRSVAVDTFTFSMAGNPLAVASYGTQVFIAAGSSLMLPRKSLLTKGQMVALLISSTYLIIRSGSRGQLLAALIGLALAGLVFLRAGQRRNFLYVLIPGCIVALVLSVAFQTYEASDEGARFAGRWQWEQMSTELERGRVAWIRELLAYWWSESARNPTALFVGMGTGATFGVIGFYCHNVPVEMLGEYGLLGAAIYLGLLVALVSQVIRLCREPTFSIAERCGLAVLFGWFISEFVLGLKQGSFLGNTFFLTLCLVIARVYAISPLSGGGRPRAGLTKEQSQVAMQRAAMGEPRELVYSGS